MYNCYFNSISPKYRGSVSYSFNDYYCFLDNRCVSSPNLLKPSHCCVCCANNSLYEMPINPTFLYGQRQSTLIQCSPSRKLVLDGINRGYLRPRICDSDSNGSYRKSCTFKESSSFGRKGKLRKGRYGCNVDDVEVILSLLTGEVGDEFFGVRKRNDGRERNGSRERNARRVQLEESVDSFYKGPLKDVKRGALKGNSKHECESFKLQPRKGDMQQKEDMGEEKREFFPRGESCSRLRSEGSNCSSYYSLASLGEFESDTQIRDKRDAFAGESSSDFERRNHGESRYEREVSEEVNRKRGYDEQEGVVSKKEDNSKSLYESSSVDINLRKKSEKKLETELTEQTESWNKSSEKHLSLSIYHESGYGKSFEALKQCDDRKETSSFALNDATGQQHRQIGQRVGGLPESRIKCKQFTEIPDTYDIAVEAASGSKKLYNDREQDLLGSSSFVQNTREEQIKTDDLVTIGERQRRNSQKLIRSSTFQEIDNREAFSSDRQSETRMKSLEDDATVLPRLVDDLKEQHGHADQPGPSREFQQWTGISNSQNIKIQNTFISQNKSDSRMVIQKDSSENAGASYPEAIRRTESRKDSQGILSQNDAKIGTNSGKRMGSVVKLDEKSKDRYNLIDERVMHRAMPTDAQRPTRATSFQRGIAEEASSSSVSSNLGSQSIVHHIGVNLNDNTIPSATARAQLPDEPTSWHRTDDSHSESLRSGSSALHLPALDGGGDRSGTRGDPVKLVSHDDVIGSAARLQQSSTQFVGEFVDKVRHEVSTSEVQKERTSQTMLLHEGESREQEGVGHYSSGDSEQKDHDRLHLSQGSEAKGPSDEVWNVTDPSIQESRKTEVPEATTTTENSAFTKTGRSMWSVISDIVRLHWASHSETKISRSGGKSSSDQSTSSDAWFSGHEADENNDENIKQRRDAALQDSSSVDQERHGGIHTHYKELSRSKRSKDKTKHVELGLASSSISESVSEPKGILSSKIEETVAKHSEGSSFGIIDPESSLPLPAIRMARSPVVQEISEASEADISGGGMMALSGQPGSTNMIEVSVSEGKTGELKQRKLQRNKQVVRDKFDEWEEAYTFETQLRKNDEMFMREALHEAKKAADVWEVPVGAVLVQHGKIIARGHNLVEELRDSTAHAEMICIREASNILRSWRLADTTLYVTLEPCPMCAGAIFQARIDTIVWGAPNKLLGADGSWIRLFPNGSEGHESTGPSDKPAAPVHPFHPNVKLRRGVLASECAEVMQQFFQLRRKKKVKQQEQPTPPSSLPISSRPAKFFSKMHGAFNIMFCL